MKVTLITGASAGIGEAFARRLASEKHDLLLVARSEEKLRVLCDELIRTHKINAQYFAIDLAQAGADQRVFEETEKRNLEVDLLINNAGIGSAGDFAQLDLKSEQDMIALNITTLVGLTHHYLQKMRARKSGTIVNVASLAAFLPAPFMGAYAATKAFVRSFTEAIIEENRPYNVKIMLLCPGATETNFFTAAKIDTRDKANMVGGNLQTPEQVVDAAMIGLSKGKRVAISGAMNRMMVRAMYVVPNSFITRTLAKRLRTTFDKKQ